MPTSAATTQEESDAGSSSSLASEERGSSLASEDREEDDTDDSEDEGDDSEGGSDEGAVSDRPTTFTLNGQSWSFDNPVSLVLAAARQLGMAIGRDARLLWIADEALLDQHEEEDVAAMGSTVPVAPLSDEIASHYAELFAQRSKTFVEAIRAESPASAAAALRSEVTTHTKPQVTTHTANSFTDGRTNGEHTDVNTGVHTNPNPDSIQRGGDGPW